MGREAAVRGQRMAAVIWVAAGRLGPGPRPSSGESEVTEFPERWERYRNGIGLRLIPTSRISST